MIVVYTYQSGLTMRFDYSLKSYDQGSKEWVERVLFDVILVLVYVLAADESVASRGRIRAG